MIYYLPDGINLYKWRKRLVTFVCPPHFWNQAYTLGLTWTGSSCLVIIASVKWLQHLQALFSRSEMWFIHSSEWSLPTEEAVIMKQNYFIWSVCEKNVLFSKISWRIILRDSMCHYLVYKWCRWCWHVIVKRQRECSCFWNCSHVIPLNLWFFANKQGSWRVFSILNTSAWRHITPLPEYTHTASGIWPGVMCNETALPLKWSLKMLSAYEPDDVFLSALVVKISVHHQKASAVHDNAEPLV